MNDFFSKNNPIQNCVTNWIKNSNLKNIFVKVVFVKILVVIFALASIIACDKMSDDGKSGSNESKPKAVYKKPRGNKHRVVWDRIRSNFDIQTPHKHTEERQRIQKFVHEFQANEERLARITTKASPYLHYIIEEIEKRNLPGELALLPVIESAFEPQATSRKGAAGLWQFMPPTGRQFGLTQDKWYDGRRDIRASTKAALDYLEFLHQEFGYNWMLALAAYNAGPGTVQKAIDRNLREGKPVNFWSLRLPKETAAYVPKFLALAEVVANPEKHDLSLPHIDNKPYFKTVDTGKHLTFNKVAKLAEVNVQELKRLNPGYRKESTHPKGPKQLLLPVENAAKLEDQLAEGNVVEDVPPKEVAKPAPKAKAKVKVKAKGKAKAQKAKAKTKAKAKVKSKAKGKILSKVKLKAKARRV